MRPNPRAARLGRQAGLRAGVRRDQGSGALAGGALVPTLGRYKALVLFGIIRAIAVAGYALLAAGILGEGFLFPLCFGEHFLGSMATAAAFTVMMDLCDPDSAATDYTVQASVVVIAKIAAATASGFVAQALGYLHNFTISALLSLAGALLLARVYRDWSTTNGAVQL